MLTSLNMTILLSLFIVSSICVWVLGIKVTQFTDAIDNRFGISQEFGGIIFLAIVTNLSNIAIVIGASLTNNLGMAIGNILGGIAIQTVVLVLLDAFGLHRQAALTQKPINLKLVLEGLLVVVILVITIMSSQLPKSLLFFRISPGDISIFFSWLIGLWLIRKAGDYLPWTKKTKLIEHRKEVKKYKKIKTIYLITIFIILALATLIAGLVLEESSSAIAEKLGLSSTLFGATILAAITALPELSTGLAAIKMRDYALAISDIFGGNAFLPVLFLLATIISGTPVLSHLQKTDIYLASLGALLTLIYLYGLIFSSKRQFYCLGIDSVVVLLIYIFGVVGLVFLI